jgi:hypothetical protein
MAVGIGVPVRSTLRKVDVARDRQAWRRDDLSAPERAVDRRTNRVVALAEGRSERDVHAADVVAKREVTYDRPPIPATFVRTYWRPLILLVVASQRRWLLVTSLSWFAAPFQDSS